MKSFLNRVGLLIICLLEILVGVIIVFNPAHFAKAVLIVAGVGLIVYGVISIILYIRSEPLLAAAGFRLFKGLTALVAGLVCVLNTDGVYKLISGYFVLFGIMALLLGVYKIQTAADMFRLRLRYWYVALVSALLSLAFAAVIFVNPFKAADTLWLFIGVCVIVEGISDLITFLVGKITDKLEDELEDEGSK